MTAGGETGGAVIVVATKNPGKVREFAYAFEPLGRSVRSMFDYEGLPDIVEDGVTFAENARKKARVVGDALGIPVLADDSGLETARLDGAPGVYSARYAGEAAGDAANNAKLLRELGALAAEEPQPGGLPDGIRALSRARFVCALALYDPASGTFTESEGACDGWIVDRPLGEGGFGYDPLFWTAAYGRTMGQLTPGEKQAISHRGKALAQLIERVRLQA